MRSWRAACRVGGSCAGGGAAGAVAEPLLSDEEGRLLVGAALLHDVGMRRIWR